MAASIKDRAGRIDWLDCSKGLCIVFVVMLYATELVASDTGHTGWIAAVEHFVQPFRMPDFFLLSGLLLARVIGRDWRTYLDRKALHFAYFYVLWLTILFAFEVPRGTHDGWKDLGADYLHAYVHPYSMLWFIYMLPIFFVVTKLLRRVPAALVWTAAAALQVAGLQSELKVLDKFTAYYVYFYTGFVVAPLVIALAEKARAHRGHTLAILAAWATINGSVAYLGVSGAPLLSLALGLAGATAVVAVCALGHRLRPFRFLAYCGKHSIVIYLAFLIPMEVSRKIGEIAGLTDPSMLVLLSTAGGVLGALALHRMVQGTALDFLFERPEQFSLRGTGWKPRASYAT